MVLLMLKYIVLIVSSKTISYRFYSDIATSSKRNLHSRFQILYCCVGPTAEITELPSFYGNIDIIVS
jgi:hypothetical protein